MVAVIDAKAAVPGLLAAGAAVNAKENIEGQTALALAAHFGDLAVAQELVRYGADVNAASMHGETPLMSAAGSCQTPLVRFLIREGAHDNARHCGGGSRFS
jgi:ankyrin repeat protein